MARSAMNKVLIVDDEPLISSTLLTIFTNAGYNARAVYSAEEAIALVCGAKWVPQFTLLDVHLPGMNGIDLAVLLRQECPGCSITLFSGQSSTSDLLEAATRQGHQFDVVAKPIHPAELLNLAAQRLAPDQSCLLAQ